MGWIVVFFVMSQRQEIRDSIVSVADYNWRIDYKGATCKFESTSPEDAVIHHLEVPEDVRNQGIGTDMIRVAEQFLKENTEVSMLYAQIGEESGSTQYILEKKLGFDVIGVDERETLGEVVDAQKKLN